jgi:antitoxin component YwqK of YwqJK toxin-antitoxin module
MKINRPMNHTDDNGLKQGYWEYYDRGSGLLNSKGFYKDNKPDGKWEFYLFGNLSQKGSYKNNKKDGVWETYSGSGNLISRVLYKDGSISKRLPLDEMKINMPKNHTDGNGLKQGYWEEYYPNDKLMSKGLYKNDKKEGIWPFYYANGKLKSKGLYKNNKRDGDWVFYYMNGNIELEGSYKNDLKDGVWETYYFNGQLYKKDLYNNNKKDGVWETYYTNGNLMYKGPYKNDLRDGVWEWYDEYGNLGGKEIWDNGKLVKQLPIKEMKVNAPSAFIEEENTEIDPIILAFLKYWVDDLYWLKYTSFKDVYEFALENDYVDGDEISFENFSNQMKPYINRIIALGDTDSMAYLVVKPGGVMGVSEESIIDDYDGDFDLLDKQMRKKALKYLSKND